MKIAILLGIALVAAVLFFLAMRWRGEAGSQTPPGSTASPSDLDAFKAWLFADQTLEELAGKDTDGAGDPWHAFAQARLNVREGDTEEAKKILRSVLPTPETRIRLFAWKALRELGENPEPGAAEEVQGVVIELHNEAGVGTIAAYEDGRARWLGGQGAVTVWESPGSDARISKAIAELLRSAAPLVKRTPVFDRHRSSVPERDHLRISILTYGGIHIHEAYGPELTETHEMTPALMASTQLLDALPQK